MNPEPKPQDSEPTSADAIPPDDDLVGRETEHIEDEGEPLGGNFA